jgi:hypothetical protein
VRRPVVLRRSAYFDQCLSIGALDVLGRLMRTDSVKEQAAFVETSSQTRSNHHMQRYLRVLVRAPYVRCMRRWKAARSEKKRYAVAFAALLVRPALITKPVSMRLSDCIRRTSSS